jgi:hypothetical protein
MMDFKSAKQKQIENRWMLDKDQKRKQKALDEEEESKTLDSTPVKAHMRAGKIDKEFLKRNPATNPELMSAELMGYYYKQERFNKSEGNHG